MPRPVLALLLLLCAAPLAAQETCPDGRITHIFVDNRSLFDLSELGNPSYGWAYRLANRVHIRTRQRFLLRELLVKEGGCYDAFKIQDSERLLRRYDFLARVDVYGIRQPDGNWHVVVDTRDDWTLVVDLKADVNGGLRLKELGLTEENFLGQGMTVGAFYHKLDAVREVGGQIFTPRLFNTRLDGSLQGGRTRVGPFLDEELFYPFVGEVGRFAARQRYFRREDYFSYSVGPPGESAHLLLPVDEERSELTMAARVGEPGNLTVFGLGFSRERLAFPGYPGDVKRVDSRDFSAQDSAPADDALRLADQTHYRSGTRINLLLGQRNIDFVQRQGLDALRGIQDVEVGTEMSLTLGRSLGFLASEGRPDDLYTRVRIYGAGAPSPFVIVSNFGIEARQIFSGATDREGWRDILAEGDLLFYWQSAIWPRHTLFARLAGAGGWEMDQPFQLTLGGRTGVRGYRDEDYPGGRRIVASAEDRIYFGWPYPDLFDLGATLFADMGRMWAGDAPFGFDSGWRATVGAGLRIGFPAGTRGVVRVDLAFPVESGAGFSDLVFRVSFSDLLGLTESLEDPDMARSRRTPVGPDRFNPPR